MNCIIIALAFRKIKNKKTVKLMYLQFKFLIINCDFFFKYKSNHLIVF